MHLPNDNSFTIANTENHSNYFFRFIQVFTRHFWLNETLKAAISAKRLHHQVLPMEVSYEEGYDNEILDGLRRKGHNLTTDHGVLGFAAITAISRAKGYVEAVFDPRRFGSIEIH